MKPILVISLVFAFLSGSAGYAQTLALPILPPTAQHFGTAVNGGNEEITADFAISYLLFQPVTAESIDAYRVRLEEYGFLEREVEQEGMLLWRYEYGDAPILLLIFSGDEAFLCYPDGAAFLADGAADAQTGSDPSDVTYLALDLCALFGYAPPPNSSKETTCIACYGSGICRLCNGTGTYTNYGISIDCSCEEGVCSICDGAGYY